MHKKPITTLTEEERTRQLIIKKVKGFSMEKCGNKGRRFTQKERAVILDDLTVKSIMRLSIREEILMFRIFKNIIVPLGESKKDNFS